MSLEIRQSKFPVPSNDRPKYQLQRGKEKKFQAQTTYLRGATHKNLHKQHKSKP